MNWYLTVLKRSFDFNGRSHRAEYWYFVLFSVIISFVLGFIDGAMGTPGQVGIGLLGAAYSIAIIIPSIAVGVRRLHDTGRSGWWLLVAIVPIVGPLALIFFFVQDSNEGINDYGPNPKLTPVFA